MDLGSLMKYLGWRRIMEDLLSNILEIFVGRFLEILLANY
jgi:hypothetical protein